MADIAINGSNVGTPLQALLCADDITPGSELSYELVKIIYLWHPLGGKMVEKPIKIAQSQKRRISIPRGPEEMVREAFERTWDRMRATQLIKGTMTQARIYGIGTIVYGAQGIPNDTTIDPWELAGLEQQGRLFFNVFDPLNTAGSLVLNQDPNSPNYQKIGGKITAGGQAWDYSRSCVVMNEQPIYIAYSYAAFGYVGRSVYQRALFPLKSYVQSMITDDMVTRKAGVLIAKLKQAGSIVNKLMQQAAGFKRAILKEAETNNVITIEQTEEIESINLQNTDTAMTVARKNIIENIASGCDMPAQLLTQESFAEGFGEGSEDAKAVVQYINGVREDMQPLYDFMDRFVQHCAWTPEFYATVQAQFPDEYGGVDYRTAFYDWRNSFTAVWPSLIEEPESELVKTDKVMLEGITDVLTAILPTLDPENKALMIEWAVANMNERKRMFSSTLTLDIDALASYVPPVPEAGFGGGGGGPEGEEAPPAKGNPNLTAVK
jgi:hypothetical protein